MEKIINWSTMSPRERDAVVAEALDLLEPEVIKPYKMCNGEPIWSRTPNAQGFGMPITCDHFTTRWSGLKQIIKHWRRINDGNTICIEIKAKGSSVWLKGAEGEIWHGYIALANEADSDVPEMVCCTLLEHLGYTIL